VRFAADASPVRERRDEDEKVASGFHRRTLVVGADPDAGISYGSGF
jgi:hypothetical protein